MNNVALITGASSGLGLEFAKLFAKDGHDLVLVARSIDRLDKLAAELEENHKVKVLTVAADLSTPEGVAALLAATKAAQVKVTALVNNAGFGDCADFAEADIAKLDQMIELNVRALTDLTYYYLADMLEAGTGRILNVASVAAFEPGPGMATYFATKAFVLSLSEALAEELRGTGITVTALCPGTTNTSFWKVAEASALSFAREANMATPESVAAFGYEAMKGGRVVAVPGLVNKLMVGSVRFVPRAVVRRIVRMIMR